MPSLDAPPNPLALAAARATAEADLDLEGENDDDQADDAIIDAAPQGAGPRQKSVVVKEEDAAAEEEEEERPPMRVAERVVIIDLPGRNSAFHFIQPGSGHRFYADVRSDNGTADSKHVYCISEEILDASVAYDKAGFP